MDDNEIDFEEFCRMKAVMNNLADILDEKPYKETEGFLNSSPNRIADFKVTLASAIEPEYR